MRYRVHHAWPIQGGSAIVFGGTIVDDAQLNYLTGVVPPPDSTPLDEQTRAWLMQAYPYHTIAAVPPMSK